MCKQAGAGTPRQKAGGMIVPMNYRMSPIVAARGLELLKHADQLLADRKECADRYREVVDGCDWLQSQLVPPGWDHSYWTYAVACDTPERCLWLLDAMERHGGERPYPAWLLSYHEPALAHLAGPPVVQVGDREFALKRTGLCPVAEDLQPRLVQMQTNNLASAERNAKALRQAIEEATNG